MERLGIVRSIFGEAVGIKPVAAVAFWIGLVKWRQLLGSPGYSKNALYINSLSADEVMRIGNPV